jgi:hypothetical protein
MTRHVPDVYRDENVILKAENARLRDTLDVLVLLHVMGEAKRDELNQRLSDLYADYKQRGKPAAPSCSGGIHRTTIVECADCHARFDLRYPVMPRPDDAAHEDYARDVRAELDEYNDSNTPDPNDIIDEDDIDIGQVKRREGGQQ